MTDAEIVALLLKLPEQPRMGQEPEHRVIMEADIQAAADDAEEVTDWIARKGGERRYEKGVPSRSTRQYGTVHGAGWYWMVPLSALA